MTLIYGTYDQQFLDAVFNEARKSGSKEDKQWWNIFKYIASGNVFLAGWVHTHGPLSDISQVYDEIVRTLKTKGLPEYRRFTAMVGKALQESQNTKPSNVF
jgi:hypothetical protein